MWDVITVDEYFDKKSKTPYSIRFDNMNKVLSPFQFSTVSVVETKIINSYEEAWQYFQKALNNGEEGLVLKSNNGTWKNDKPKWQVKMKLEMDMDLLIVGFNYGTGKNSNVISSLNCESSCGELKTKPTGINEETMKYITDNQTELLNTIVEVKCSGTSTDVNGNYSLFHPVFKSLRTDKTTADSLTQILKIEAAAKSLS
jgi:ATP-dependent DNA ligase